MSEWEIIITPDAGKDIYDIYHYIAETLFVPETAGKQVRRILQEIHSLKNMPLRYALYAKEPWHSCGLRHMPVDHFIVFYLPDEEKKKVAVLHVLYGGRDVDRYLAEPR